MSEAWFGGSFSPPHIGHLVLAERVREARGLKRVHLLVSAEPPHAQGKQAIEASHRLAMAKLAVAGNPGLDVDDRELRRGGKSYTIDTARELIAQGIRRPAFIVGGDMLADLPSWREGAELLRLADVIPVLRPGFGWEVFEALRAAFGDEAARRVRDLCVKTPLLQISSSEMRERLLAGKSIRYLVPDAVIEYIGQKGLYT
ncbi:MAG: Nicotinate-nucleotide adenylyltransferase [Planctomycetes bacterium]|nr:Nicotinate-nucleotide adenylyltransferase [Planctomycetota bacterium]MCQ3948289.1 nicotinate (nicotinamide) nucleotide adenylyltransferase [Planctomycetota bacterium]GIK52818.1 MAG: putative nicotinate-nucleotide adenylyltransferase [Planctomycetota bacterium]HRJ78871.1 nicotinate (nicotinamide) nucleotide adenylyltransferase [Planctomycetota bacterium]